VFVFGQRPLFEEKVMFKGYKFLDADSHILEPDDLFEKYLEPGFRSHMPRAWTKYQGDPPAWGIEVITPTAQCDGGRCEMPFGRDIDVNDPELALGLKSVVLPGHDVAYSDLARRGFRPESYPDALDRAGIDRMVVYPTAGLWYTQDPHLDAATAGAYRRAYNNWLHDFCSAAGPRAVGAATIDLRDPQEAAREARRCAKEFGFRAVTFNPAPVGEHRIYEGVYDRLWSELEDLDVPVAVHCGTGSPTDEMLYYYLPALKAVPEFRFAVRAAQSVFAFVLGNMITAAAFIMGGVLERHPKLKVVHLECGAGWVPFWMDRLASGIQGGFRGLEMPGLKLSPVEYFKRQCYIACDQDDPDLRHVTETIGADNVVLSTDFGHPEGRRYIEAAREFLEAPIPDDSKRKIMWDNGARLYGIGD
jgi:uncharacterized protein